MSIHHTIPVPIDHKSGYPGALKARLALTPMLRKLRLWRELSSDDEAAILALPHEIVELGASRYIVRDGDQAGRSCLLISGYAFRQKLTGDGARSINAIQMPGDIVDLQNALLPRADHNVQTLTKATVAFIPREAILELAFRVPAIGFALWYDTLVDASIGREWIINLSRRDAQSRIAHVMCEFGVRLEALGLGDRCCYEMPFTQEQLADTTGLTPVHVNRSLKALEERGFIERKGRRIRVADWALLERVADFDPSYLHLPAGVASRLSSR